LYKFNIYSSIFHSSILSEIFYVAYKKTTNIDFQKKDKHKEKETRGRKKKFSLSENILFVFFMGIGFDSFHLLFVYLFTVNH
jgi:hypothetical protein